MNIMVFRAAWCVMLKMCYVLLHVQLMQQCFFISKQFCSHYGSTYVYYKLNHSICNLIIAVKPYCNIKFIFQNSCRSNGIWMIGLMILVYRNALWACTLSPFALLMARRGLSTRNTRRIFTTEMALELNTETTTNKWMNQWITELSHRWTLTAKRKRWGTRWRPAGPGGWRRFCRRNLDEGKLHTQSSEQHTTHIFINVHI